MKFYVMTPTGERYECDSVQAIMALRVTEKLNLKECTIIKGVELAL